MNVYLCVNFDCTTAMLHDFEYWDQRRFPVLPMYNEITLADLCWVEAPELMLQYLIGQVRVKSDPDHVYRTRCLDVTTNKEPVDLMHIKSEKDIFALCYAHQVQKKWPSAQSHEKFVCLFVCQISLTTCFLWCIFVSVNLCLTMFFFELCKF